MTGVKFRVNTFVGSHHRAVCPVSDVDGKLVAGIEEVDGDYLGKTRQHVVLTRKTVRNKDGWRGSDG